MKKNVMKLVLSKETIRALGGQDLADVNGGTFSTGCASRIQHCFNTQQVSCLC
jgi:hypothetical protein